jgi:hypothetical protein
MPNSGALGVVQKIMTTGMNNYPESASQILFISPPAVFSGIFAIIKRWLPEEVSKKFGFVPKQDIPKELLKYVRPSIIVALQDLHNGRPGDDICEELITGSGRSITIPATVEMTINVAARDTQYVYYELSGQAYKKITWTRLNLDESPKSPITAKIYYVKPGTEASQPESVEVVCVSLPTNVCSAELPDVPNVTEALLCLCLDHTSAWLQSHTFRFTVDLH